MGESKHTPGPWIAYDREPIDAHLLADANFLAAAPDLVYVLESKQSNPQTPLNPREEELLRRARAAIAKVRGEPSEEEALP